MSPSKKRHLDPERMLDEAEQLFAENGYGSCSLRDVMSATGASTTAFYARFDGKEDVFDRVVSRFIEALRATVVRTIETTATMEEGFAVGARAFVDALLERRELVAVILAEGASTDGSRERLRLSYGSLADLIAEQFARIGDSAPTARAWALVGAIQMQVFRWAVLGELDDGELHTHVLEAARTLIP